MDSGDNKYDKLDDSPDMQPTGDKDELLLDDLSKNKFKNSNSSGNDSGPNSPLRKPKKVIEASKAILADQSRGLRIIVICAFVFSIIITVALILSIYLGPPQIGANAAVATDVKKCSQIGLQILEQGGNAVDAAVSSMFCVGVVNPESSGIGGGGFMLVHDHKNHKSEVFDFRETAPAAATPDMFSNNPDKKRVGGLAVAVPGELRGMEAAHQKYGKLSWSKVIAPAANLARNGYKMTGHTAKVLQSSKLDQTSFKASKLSRFYPDFTGTVLIEGDTIKRPDLAKTLDIIASDGADAFYDGKLTDEILSAITNSKTPGHMTRGDLKNYKVEMREVVSTTFHDYTIESVPAPGAGPVLLSIMNILEGYSLKKDDGESYHRIVEALKFGYANKELLGDPVRDSKKTVENATKIMISKEYAKQIRNKTADLMKPQNASFYGDLGALPRDSGTSHISVIDSAELMVSVTTTINDWFGSMVMTDSGILLNNQMADFSSTGGEALNQVAPGKRPQSSMAPSIVYQTNHPCGLRMVIGAANGSRIISGIAETLVYNLTFNLPLEKAIAASRIHSQLYPDPDVVEVEDGFSPKVIEALKSQGYKVVKNPEGLSEVQAVVKIKDGIEAESDRRKGGAGADLFTS